MNTKKYCWVFAALIATQTFAQLRPGEGIANDHARGENSRDVVFVARGGGNGYGYNGGMSVIGATFLPWSLPDCPWKIKGVRFNFGWGYHSKMIGLDSGLFGTSGYLGGISATLLGNLTFGDADGLQIGAVNVVSERTRGVQIGVVNYANELNGLQIGLLNFNNSGITFPIINIGF